MDPARFVFLDETAPNQDALWSTIGTLLDSFPPHECANYLAHCGYGST